MTKYEQQTTEIRELNDNELDEANGGTSELIKSVIRVVEHEVMACTCICNMRSQ